MTSLISIGDLITNGLKDIQKTWKPTLKYTVWFFLAPILSGLVAFLVAVASITGGSGNAAAGSVVLIVFAYVAMLLGLAWAWIGLMRYMLEYAKGASMKNWKPPAPAISYLPRIIWVSILVLIPIAAAWSLALTPLWLEDTLRAGALMAVLFLAAMTFTIWISIAFSQTCPLILTDEARGVEALKRSYALVSGRWWKTLWRFFLPNAVFQIIVWTVMSLFYGLVFFIGFMLLGGWLTTLGFTYDVGPEAARASNISFGILGIVSLIFMLVAAAALMIVQIIAQAIYQGSVTARLFFSLEATKSK